MHANKTADPMKEALQAMFLAFPSQERDGREREMAELYILAVEGINRAFVALACKRFIQGQVPRQNFTWRPTPADLAVEARRLQDAAGESARIRELPHRRERLRIPGPKPKFEPYPKLWAALRNDPDLLKALEAMTFDGMTDISKIMATEGLDAAKGKLRRLASMPARQKDAAA